MVLHACPSLPPLKQLASVRTSDVALVELDIHLQPEVVRALEGVGAEGGDAARHEEVAGAADDGDVPRLRGDGVGAHEVERAPVRRGVEHEREGEPRAQRLLPVVEVEALGARHGLRRQRAPRRHRVVEHHHLAEVGVVDGHRPAQQRRLRRDRRRRVRRVGAVVQDVVVVDRHLLARLVVARDELLLAAMGDAAGQHKQQDDDTDRAELVSWREALHCYTVNIIIKMT
jgi:hypothetical protein